MNDTVIEARHIMRASGHKNEPLLRNFACRLNEPKKRQISGCLSFAKGTVIKIPTESHIDQENSFSSLTQKNFDAIL